MFTFKKKMFKNIFWEVKIHPKHGGQNSSKTSIFFFVIFALTQPQIKESDHLKLAFNQQAYKLFFLYILLQNFHFLIAILRKY